MSLYHAYDVFINAAAISIFVFVSFLRNRYANSGFTTTFAFVKFNLNNSFLSNLKSLFSNNSRTNYVPGYNVTVFCGTTIQSNPSFDNRLIKSAALYLS